MREYMLNDIVSKLKGMNEKQLKNVYEYVCDEESEEDHESKLLEVLEGILIENGRLRALDEMRALQNGNCLHSMSDSGFIRNESDT